MPSPVRYIIHPGWIRSARDGSLHYITARTLMSLYQLNLHDPSVHHPIDHPSIHYVVDQDGRGFGICETPGDIHLYPRADGDYSLPAAGKLKGEELRQAMIEEFGAMPLKIRLLILLAAVVGLFWPGIVYTSFLTGIAQKITSDQQGTRAMTWLMRELAKLENDEAEK